ncbi:flagellar basal body rod C-terminal domain-containing protein [Undibacterium sp. SXout7W]|uniref:flagellar basal body rod C-terminal domain-containing protein n=1 Tax=Undibacterium sp. SXout7W TaxID=3413049 RepID=UPI003BF03F6F
MSISALNTGLSGLKAYERALDSSAHNVANTNTANFSPENVSFQESNTGGVVANISREGLAAASASGTDLNTETVKSLEYKAGFDVSAKLVKTADEVLGTLINIKA